MDVRCPHNPIRAVPGIQSLGFLALAVLAGCGGGGGGGGSKPAPTVTLSANPTTVNSGATAQLTWSSTNATSCTASGAWSGAKAVSGTETSPAITAASTFTLSCTGAGGTRQASANVVLPPAPAVAISALPASIHAGATSHLTWSSTNANTCVASDGWTGNKSTSGGEDVGPITASTIYTLTCDGDGGSASASATVTFRAGINVPPTANAGLDQTVLSSAVVTLNGGGSSDDAVISLYTWTQTAGPAVTLTGNPGIAITFVAPTVATATVVTISLVVTDDEGAVSAPDTVSITVNPVPATVTLQGQVEFELVPFGAQGTGLNYAALSYVPLTPAVLVEVVDGTTFAVLASGRFSQNYSLVAPSVRDVKLRVTATTLRQAPDALPHWDVSVRDLDEISGAPLGPVHSYTGPQFNSAAGGVHDIQIPSGWNAAGTLVGERASAPFAVLNAVQTGLTRVLSAEPNADFPALTVDWGPNNEGGVTFFTRDGAGRRIVLAAEVNVDTDEYDSGIILHEFGHYIDDAFSRSDSIGGSHSISDRLDLRVAFGEGLATAFSAMARDNALMRDSFGANQHQEGIFNVENESGVDGWYSESSTQELVYDLYDGTNDAGDTLALGFQPIWNVWHGVPHSQTPAVTSLYSFMAALKQALPANVASIDAMLASEQLVAADAYGSTETNNAGGSADVLPVYTSIALGGTTVLRSTNAFGVGNKLSTHRFLKFTLLAQGNVKFDLTAAAGRDPDIQVYRQGVQLAPVMGPANESFTLNNLTAADYVLDIYDCGNAGCNDMVAPAPTDLTISVTSN
ncbi:MAG TPA: hypothetical protein VE046_01210 [Steroidobacteraceae bacterium]|nr:hypothetical protein [Steroidobacteraceae bacterium]